MFKMACRMLLVGAALSAATSGARAKISQPHGRDDRGLRSGRLDRSGGARAGAEIPGAARPVVRGAEQGRRQRHDRRDLAARAAPDGYTLYEGYTSELVVVPQISKSAKYSVDDFEPIAVTGLVPLVLITSKNVRANTVPEFIAEMRAAPGKYTYGGGIGAPPHVMGAWFNRVNNLNVTHVPYRGGGQAVADVVGGHIDMFYAGLAAAKGAINSGSVKALAVTGDVRSSALPNVPTFKETGVKDFELASWNVLLAPKGTPADIISLLRKETALALADPKVREIYSSQGVEPSQTQDVKAFLAHERDAFGRVVREIGISMD